MLKGVPVPGIVVYELGSDSPVRMYIRGAAPVLPRLGFRTLRLEEFALALERGEAVREFGGGSHPGVLRSQRLVALPVPRRP